MIWEGNLLKRLGKRYCVIATRGEARGNLVIPVLGVFSVSIWSLGSHPDTPRGSQLVLLIHLLTTGYQESHEEAEPIKAWLFADQVLSLLVSRRDPGFQIVCSVRAGTVIILVRVAFLQAVEWPAPSRCLIVIFWLIWINSHKYCLCSPFLYKAWR